MPRHKLKPDTRLRWNDPDLTVWYGGRERTADEYQELCQKEMDACARFPQLMDWRQDKTYNIKSKLYRNGKRK